MRPQSTESRQSRNEVRLHPIDDLADGVHPRCRALISSSCTAAYAGARRPGCAVGTSKRLALSATSSRSND